MSLQEVTISRVGNQEKVYMRTDFGLPINRAIAKVIGFLIASETEAPVPISMDEGRIILETEVEPRAVESKLMLLEEDDVERLLREALESSGAPVEEELRAKYDVLGARKAIGMIRSGQVHVSAIELREPMKMTADLGNPRTFARGLRTWTESLVLTVPAGTLAGQEAFVERRVRATGRIRQLVLFFPAGTQGTTGVFMTNEGEQVFPATDADSIALDSVAQPYDVDLEVRRGDRLRFNGNNSDTVSHTVRLQYTVQVSSVE